MALVPATKMDHVNVFKEIDSEPKRWDESLQYRPYEL